MATIFTMPTVPRFRTSTFVPIANVQIFRSPLTGSIQTVELPGMSWSLTAQLPVMNRNVAAPWTAFLTKLRGPAGRFYGYDPDRRVPRGTARVATVSGVWGSFGTLINFRGMVAGATLLEGDYFSIETTKGRELKMVVGNFAANGSGNMTSVVFEPPLRGVVADGATVTLVNPSCIMMLNSADHGWTTDEASMYQIQISATEAPI